MTENEAREFLGRFSLDRIGYASGKGVDTERFNYFTEVLMTAIQALTEIQQYRAIGTVEECQEARERQRAKKVSNRELIKDFNGNPYTVRGDCPNCGNVNLVSSANYCNVCSQKLDWSE